MYFKVNAFATYPRPKSGRVPVVGLFPVVAFSVSNGQTRAGKALATDQPTCRRRPRKGIHRSLSGDVAVYVTIAPREGGIDRCRENAETTAGKFVHIGKPDRHSP